MNIDPVGFLPAVQDIALTTSETQPLEPGGRSDFASWIAKELGSVNDKLANSDMMLQRLATGEVDNLHQVMISLEDAKLSFQLLVQVRNKLLEAYSDILKMQV
jgi:flagellar hook-basal body complex protein FliE